jgi:hypothetical protein
VAGSQGVEDQRDSNVNCVMVVSTANTGASLREILPQKTTFSYEILW